jgi:hypothetical protein
LGFVSRAADTLGAYGLEGERFLAQLFSRFSRKFGNDGETSAQASFKASAGSGSGPLQGGGKSARRR